MGKKILKDNYRVEVYPRNKGDFGMVHLGGESWTPDEAKKICESMVNKIKKHLSKHEDDRGDVSVTFDIEFACEFCGSKWTEDDKKYNGGCCGKDEAQLEEKLPHLQTEESE